MNNIAYGFYFNFFFFLGLVYYLKYDDALSGFGIISAGVLLCYCLDDIFRIFNFLIKKYKGDKKKPIK